MTTKYSFLHILINIWLLFRVILKPIDCKTDPKFKFGPLYPPHDRTIINDFDTYAIHYCGLKDSLFNIAHCAFHALVEVLEEREIRYEDYESIINLLLQKKNLVSSQKMISSINNCENMIVPYVQFEKPKSSKSIMGVKISTKVEDYCKFAYRCINNGPITLIKSKQSVLQEHFGRWINISSQGNDGFGLILASRLDFQISKLKIRPKEPKDLLQIGVKLAAESPTKRESICMGILNNKELCSIVAPYKLNFNGWLHAPIDPIKNKPFKFDPKSMIDEKVKNIVNIQINEELPPFCIPQEIFSFKPPQEMLNGGKRKIHLYTDLSQSEKTVINQFLMHFVINYGKIPRVIFDNRSRFAIEGWLSHKNKFPIISVHNSMYSLGRKLQYKDAMSGMLYSNSGSKKEVYPYYLPQFKIFSVYSDKAHNFEISDSNPLISTCLKEGCAYYIGRSSSMSPVLVIRASAIISIKNFKQSSASFLSMFLMAFAEKYLFFPGKVESIDLIVDCRGFSLSNISTLLRIRPIILYWQNEGIINQYPLRFNNIFIIQQSDIWGTLKDILGKFLLSETIKSVKVISNVSQNPKDNTDLKLLWRYMSPYIIETDIGGARPKLQHGQFYPFKILPGPYKPFNSNLLNTKDTPSLSDWPKPDLSSPKNLYKLLPQSVFSLKAKTLDGNEDVVPINWKDSKKLLDSIPKNLWPDISVTLPEAKMEDNLENKGSKLVEDSKASQSEEQDIKTSQEIQNKTGTSKTNISEVVSVQHIPHKITVSNNGKERDILLQLMLTQKIFNNLKQLYITRLDRSKIKYNLEEQCIRLATNHISFFSNLVNRALIEMSSKLANTKHVKKAPSTISQINKRMSIFEAYRDIISTLKLSKAREILSLKGSSYLEQVKKQISELEAKLNKARQEIRSLLKEDPSILEEKTLPTWSTLSSAFQDLSQLGRSIRNVELKEKQISIKLHHVCEQLTSSLDVTKSFLDNYGKYDHFSMFESSLLLNMINTIIKNQEYSFEKPITGL